MLLISKSISKHWISRKYFLKVASKTKIFKNIKQNNPSYDPIWPSKSLFHRYKQNYREMHWPSPSHQSLVKEFIGAVRVPNRQERAAVRHQFGQKLSHHLNKLQMNQLREDRIALAQQHTLDKHVDALQRARHFLQLKQQKAHANKSHSLLERSRKAENDLARWEQVVGRNRQKYERELEEAKAVITLWNQKLEESSTRKSSHLEGLSKNLKQKLEAKQKRVLTLRLKEDSLGVNPQQLESLRSSPKHSPKHSPRKHIRLSTEGLLDRRKQQEEDFLKQSIIRTVGKQQRINQARYMRHYLQERKRKQQIDKEQMLKAMRDHNLSALKDTQNQRSQLIEQKLAKQHVKEEPLPRKRASQSLKVVFNAFTEREDSQVTSEASPNRNYSKLINEKLRDISTLMRIQRGRK